MLWEQRTKENLCACLGEEHLGRGRPSCKGPEAAVCPVYLGSCKEASVAGVEWAKGSVSVLGEFEKKRGVKGDNEDFSLNSRNIGLSKSEVEG